MLVFPQWRPEVRESACRVQRWMPAERFAPYLARPVVIPARPPLQYEDEDSSGGSSPERCEDKGVCGWRGCGASLPSVARLSAHVASNHALAHEDGLFYCGWRGCTRPHKGFNARYKMLVHVRTHTNERPHTCNQCDKSFSRAENLKIHLRSHSGEKPYVCPYEGCGKAYSNSSDRFKHTRTHTVDKPYCCKVSGCNKRYTDPSSLRKHVKTYKHFVTEETRRESSDENGYSPTRKCEPSYMNLESTSPLRYTATQTPTIPPYNPVLPIRETSAALGYTPLIDRVTYVRPFETLYPTRVPANEMSHIEYTQMYEHAYSNYYSKNISYPVLRPIIDEKNYSYEQTRIEDETIDVEDHRPYRSEPQERYAEEMPLNLICSKRLECKPIEELVKRTDLPLDLSTKINY